MTAQLHVALRDEFFGEIQTMVDSWVDTKGRLDQLDAIVASCKVLKTLLHPIQEACHNAWTLGTYVPADLAAISPLRDELRQNFIAMQAQMRSTINEHSRVITDWVETLGAISTRGLYSQGQCSIFKDG